MRVLVTGASGFIGSVVVRLLAERGHTIRCLLRDTSRTERIDGMPFEIARGDLTRPETLAPAVRDCEAVIHLASVSSWDDIHSERVLSLGLGGTSALVDAALAARCRRFVFVSSAAALGGERTPVVRNEDDRPAAGIERLVYAHMKLRAEALCRAAGERGLEVVTVNPSEVYGAADRDLVTAGNLIDLAGGPLAMVCDGGTGVVHLHDAAEGIVAALERGRPGERYLLSAENLSNRDIAAMVLDLLGRRHPIVSCPRSIVRGLGWLGTHLRIPMPFNPAIAPYVTLYWFVDSAKARRELGIDFRSGRDAIGDAVAWLRQVGKIQGSSPGTRASSR